MGPVHSSPEGHDILVGLPGLVMETGGICHQPGHNPSPKQTYAQLPVALVLQTASGF